MNHLPHLIIDLALILLAAGVVTLLFRKLRQPVVLGYIIAGLLVGPSFKLIPTVVEMDSIKIWADIGIIFLLFSLGLEFSFKKLIKVGSTAVITGFFEIAAMTITGYYLGQLMGWSNMDSLYLGGIIAISSTTIIFRAFDELNIKHKKFAGIVIGVLIIEDLVAVLLMVLLSTVAVSKQFEGAALMEAGLKLGFFLILWFITGIFFLPGILKRASKFLNDETILIISIGLCLGMVLLASMAGFSAALGAFMMGSLLAETTQAEHIERVFKPVKNLFGAVFFVSVGMLISPMLLVEYALPVLLVTICVMLGKTLYVGIGSLLSGQPLKQSIQAGTSMSQIGEFSFIIATLGVTLNVTHDFLYPIAVGVSVITTFFTPFMIRLADPLNNFLERTLPQKWLSSLNQYSTGAQRIQTANHWRNVLQSFIEIVGINSVILIAIILLTKNIVEPFVSLSGDIGKIVTATLALLAMSPFLWMLTTKKINKPSYTQLWLIKYNRGPIIVMEVFRVTLGIAFVAVLFIQLFSTIIALVIAFVIMIVAGFIFARKLHAFSMRIEDRFLDNLNLRESQNIRSKVDTLIPWDAHLAYFDIDIDSTLVGKPLSELAIREQFGVNLAMIERGNRVIMVPNKDDKLYPFDRIAVIGTDEQIMQFKSTIEAANNAQQFEEITANISLTQITVQPGFPYLGKSIRESGIREKVKGLIVGIERNGNRILNPESTMIFELNDTLWIVGDRKKVRML
ncbi:MAG: cation:proton antiporter [Bacteroidia bacterium]|jgi:CPA2 family monovalent cation:H+ antiporter-2